MASPQPPPAQAGGSAPPDFIGSIISLTSRADIRYQGRLAQIDPGQATIALEKVRSWGTEGRLASQGRPQDEIAPNDAVYDYIVFRAADVKDLKIDEQNAPRPPPPQQGLQDPAILGSSGPPGGHNQFGPPPPGYGPPPGGMYGPQGGYGRPPPSGPGGPGSYGPGGHFGGPPPPGPPSQSPQTQSRLPPQSVMQESKEKASNTTDKVVDALANLSVKEQPAGTGSSKGSAPPANANADSAPRSRNNDQPGQQGRTPRPPRVDRGMYDLPPGPEPLPGADFDFERANAQFEKEKGKVRDGAKASPSPATAQTNGAEGTEMTPNGSGEANGGVLLDAIPPADPKSFYDKKSGFFDDISSEVKERHERPSRGRGRGRGGYGGGGREQGQNGGGDHDGPQFRPRGGRGGPGRGRSIRMAEERKNLQTFGDAGGPVPGAGGAYRRGGGGGPGRGRGRGRGGQNHAQTFA